MFVSPPALAPLPQQLTMALKGVEEWQYDSFALDSATSGRPLSCLAYFLLRQSNLIRKFHLNELKLVRWAQ